MCQEIETGRERERESVCEREATKHTQWLRQRGGACSLPEVGDVLFIRDSGSNHIASDLSRLFAALAVLRFCLRETIRIRIA